MSNLQVSFEQYQLADCYAQPVGRVFLTGTQALVRALYDQARRDRGAGLKTGGFVSGYRGSPIGALDLELWREKERLEAENIVFQPGVNEDLAATAVFGSQQVESDPHREVDGVFGLWYGKGPGVDRSGDALKHGNAFGSSPHGGVLVVAGDDHGCVSSSMSHQSDPAFLSWFMPILNPAEVSEYLEFAEYGYALSRYSGMWVGFKAISETLESGRSMDLKADRIFAKPDYQIPETGLHYRWPDIPGPQIEERLEYKKHAVLSFAEANPIDRRIYDTNKAGFGFVTTGKAHLDLMEALRLLGLNEEECRKLGIDIYKVGMVWPLARRDALGFVEGKREVVVVEEKRGIIESQLKEYVYGLPGSKPERVVGKNDENGNRLIPWTGELSPLQLVPLIAGRLAGIFPEGKFVEKAEQLTRNPAICLQVEGATRMPFFCSGCPHNTSTRVPEGSGALGGIGCHGMAVWMERDTTSLVQMGGEGINWTSSSRFNGNRHVFQNIGDGTWYHSGSMAIRQAIAAGTNITYKILYNDAVAMTGGQPVDGPVSIQGVAHVSRADGAKRIALVSDDPDRHSKTDFPGGVTFHERSDLDKVQRELREVPGVSILIYDQICASEKRRRRKRGLMEDPRKFAVINELVCEGCGDCSIESNCLSIEPLETEFGRKRQINLSSCNKDFTCLNGFCPSFVTVEGTGRRCRSGADIDLAELAKGLCEPVISPLERPYDLLLTGVGGTGVITVSVLVAMAAHLEGKGISVLDFTGFAQKFGAVLSYIRFGTSPQSVNQVRIDQGCADAVIGCDIVVSSSAKASSCYRPGTKFALNTASMPTGDLVRHRDAGLHIDERQEVIEKAVGADNLSAFNANETAEALLGNAVYANVMMLGFGWQKGLVPLSLDALMRAIELNGVAVEANQDAFVCGRLMAANPEVFAKHLPAGQKPADTLEEILNRRTAFLRDYQNDAWAEKYRKSMLRFGRKTTPVGGDEIARAAAKSLFKLMSYKDEYEVARLQSDPSFLNGLEERFEGDFKLYHHFTPPWMAFRKDSRGRPIKRQFGPGIQPAFRLLARFKGLRGTPVDPFGFSVARKRERELIHWFEDLMTKCEVELTSDNAPDWLKIMRAPMDIRGYGPVKKLAIETVRQEIADCLKKVK